MVTNPYCPAGFTVEYQRCLDSLVQIESDCEGKDEEDALKSPGGTMQMECGIWQFQPVWQ